MRQYQVRFDCLRTKCGKTITVCTDDHCPVHDPATAARLAKEEAENPAPVMEPAPEEETEEEAEQRQEEYEQRRKEHEAEQQRREEERNAEQERQQEEYEAELKRREDLTKARVATFERILDQAPPMFTAAQLRTFLRLLVHIDPYNFLEEVANHFAGNDGNLQQTEGETVLAALDNAADDKLTSFALRLALSDHVGIPREEQPDLLAEAEVAFVAPPPKSPKRRASANLRRLPLKLKPRRRRQPTRRKPLNNMEGGIARAFPAPDYSGAFFLNRADATSSCREKPLRFLPDPHPALRPRGGGTEALVRNPSIKVKGGQPACGLTHATPTQPMFEIPPFLMICLAFPRVGTSEKPRDTRAGYYRCRIRVRPTRVPPYWKNLRVQSAHRYQYSSSVRRDLSNYRQPGRVP